MPHDDNGRGFSDAEDTEALLNELAALDPVEYDRRREEAADQLGCRVTSLDRSVSRRRPRSGSAAPRKLELPDPDPWPEPVDGVELLDGLVAAISRYVALPEHAAEAVALWIVHAHALDAFWISPRLAAISPEKRCGKTSLLMTIAKLVPRPLHAANVTPAAVFRAVEMVCPTLLIDEADTFLGGADELRGILNSGHCKASATVIRTAGEDYEPVQFATWSPCAIALIGKLPDTLEDRSVVIQMRRRRPDEHVQRLRLDRLGHLDEVAQKVARWALDHKTELRDADPDMPASLHDRAADNWRPLLAVADLAGGHWPTPARRAAVALTGIEDDFDSARVQLLADLRGVFKDECADQLTSAKIVAALVEMEDRPWPEWKGGKPITVRQLAKLLQPFRIKPIQMKVGGDKNLRGYKLKAFDDVFRRYLPHRTATPLQPAETLEFSRNSTATDFLPVAAQNSPKPAETLACSGVADQNRGAGGARVCRHCRGPIDVDEMSIPFLDGSEAHLRCHEAA